MPELAAVVRRFGAAYLERYGAHVLPSHRVALRSIARCRTPALGGHVWRCEHAGCTGERYAFHSCSNRSCPKCHREQSERWLRQQRARLPSCPWVLATFTLPSELRHLARSHQRSVLGAACREAAGAVLCLARDRAWLGAVPAILAVLHTWTRSMVVYHPHVHLLVSLGGVDAHGRWVAPRHRTYLVPAKALAAVFRTRMAVALRRTGLYHRAPRKAWRTDWVVDVQKVGDGEAALGYLSRYVHRIALADTQIEAVTDAGVTFHWRDRASGEVRRRTLDGLTFLGAFLQHVLPKGFAKVRSYGVLAPRSRTRLDAVLVALAAMRNAPKTTASVTASPLLRRCPVCHRETMRVVAELPRRRGPP